MTRKQKKRLPAAAWIAYVLVVVTVIFGGYSVAKYVTSQDSESVLAAKNFYLESDLLEPEGNVLPRHTLQSGVDTVEFSLMNYPDGLRVAEVDIQCKVTLTGSDGTQEQTVTLGKNTQEKKTVKFTDLEPDTYLVTVTSVSPYAYTLQAQFEVVGLDQGVSCTVSDGAGSPNLKVTVTTTDYSGYITISWPAGVLPDNTDPLLATAQGNSHTVKVEKDSEYTFQFFKTNPDGDYTESITVTKN